MLIFRLFFLRCTISGALLGKTFVDKNEKSLLSCHFVKTNVPRCAETFSPCLSLFFSHRGKSLRLD